MSDLLKDNLDTRTIVYSNLALHFSNIIMIAEMFIYMPIYLKTKMTRKTTNPQTKNV